MGTTSDQGPTGAVDERSSEAHRLLEVAAVFGPSFAASDLAEVMGQPAGALLTAVQDALEAGRPAPDGFTLGPGLPSLPATAYR